MPRKPPPERVTLTHPSGRFTVQVLPGRVDTLKARGYTAATAAKAAPAAQDATDTADAGYDALTVAQLQSELASRGLPTGGNKAALTARLTEDDEEHGAATDEEA